VQKIHSVYDEGVFAMRWHWIGQATVFAALIAATTAFGADAGNGLQDRAAMVRIMSYR
jgi:hypothetical protein